MAGGRSRPVGVAFVLVLASVSVGAGVAPVAADDGGIIDEIFGDEEETASNESDDGLFSLSTIESVLASYSGTASGLVERLEGFGDSAEATATADDVQAFANEHSAELEQYANARLDASSELDTVAIEFTGEDGSDTRYLVADVQDGNYTNVSMVATTDRTADETCEVSSQATADAPAELEGFYETFVDEERDITAGYLAELNAAYNPDVSCSFFGI
jgi:hypothetical protein